MKSVAAGLTNQIENINVYNKIKTSIFGREGLKNIGGVNVLGPPLTKFIDVHTDTVGAGVVVPNDMFLTPNGRLFVYQTAVGTSFTSLLYTFNIQTGAHAYVGKIIVTVPTLAIALHSFHVDDSASGNMKMFFSMVGGGVNGGAFQVNKLVDSDFTSTGTTVFAALSNDIKAVYKLEGANNGTLNDLTTAAGGFLYNNKLYVHNGIAATHQYFSFDYSIPPNYTTPVTASGATNLSTPTIPMPLGHGFVYQDAVVITANAPSSFTQTTQTAAPTVYYVRNNVTATSIELASTLANAATTSISPTSITTPTIGRAWGQSLNQFSFKTPNLTALTGVLLLTNSEQYCVPTSSGAGVPAGLTSLYGQDCVFFSTTLNQYLGKISDLAASMPSGWASLWTSNVLGNSTDITTPLPSYACYSTECNESLFLTNTSIVVAKELLNNVRKDTFGYLNNDYLEGNVMSTIPFSLVSPTCLRTQSGWLFECGSTAGQQVIIAMDNRSSASFDYSYAITPVIQLGNSSVKPIINSISSVEQLFTLTNVPYYQIRSASASSDAVFNSSTTGWVVITPATDLSSLVFDNYIQIKLRHRIRSMPLTTPAQVSEIMVEYTPVGTMSDFWESNNEFTTQGAVNPAYTAFYQSGVYLTSVPVLTARADSSGGSLSLNTLTNYANFSYSMDNGLNWIQMTSGMNGILPINAIGTILKVSWGQSLVGTYTMSIRES